MIKPSFALHIQRIRQGKAFTIFVWSVLAVHEAFVVRALSFEVVAHVIPSHSLQIGVLFMFGRFLASARNDAGAKAFIHSIVIKVRAVIALLGLMTLPGLSHAHIKWFAHVRVQDDPRMPWQVMTAPSFMQLALAACLAMAAVAGIDAWLQGTMGRRSWAMRWRDIDLGRHAFTLIRWGTGVCFAATALFFHAAPVILTPELRTHASWTTFLQLVITLTCFCGIPRLAALGLLALFGHAIAEYGFFHLMDYVLFIGIAICLWCEEETDEALRSHALVILRITVGLALMWGAIEKWLYPQWTFPLLCGDGRALLMGLTPDFFMQGAGFIEFCAAFTLIIGRFAARVACLVLMAVMVAAMPMFGPLDVVGHGPFVLGLAVLMLSSKSLTPIPLAKPGAAHFVKRWLMAFVASLVLLPLAYYCGHQWFVNLRDVSWLPASVLLPLLLLLTASSVPWRALPGLPALAIPYLRALPGRMGKRVEQA